MLDVYWSEERESSYERLGEVDEDDDEDDDDDWSDDNKEGSSRKCKSTSGESCNSSAS